MAETAQRTRTIITAASKPGLPHHIKLRHDAGRGRWLVLAPERVFEPDDIAVEILKRCDGANSVAKHRGRACKRVQRALCKTS